MHPTKCRPAHRLYSPHLAMPYLHSSRCTYAHDRIATLSLSIASHVPRRRSEIAVRSSRRPLRRSSGPPPRSPFLRAQLARRLLLLAFADPPVGRQDDAVSFRLSTPTSPSRLATDQAESGRLVLLAGPPHEQKCRWFRDATAHGASASTTYVGAGVCRPFRTEQCRRFRKFDAGCSERNRGRLSSRARSRSGGAQGRS